MYINKKGNIYIWKKALLYHAVQLECTCSASKKRELCYALRKQDVGLSEFCLIDLFVHRAH